MDSPSTCPTETMLVALVSQTSRLCVLLSLVPLCCARCHGDWPEHRGNTARSGYREQQIVSTAWRPAWRYDGLAAPSPAWPEPARGSLWQNLQSISPRIADDSGGVPVIALDRSGQAKLLVASSGGNQLAALDLNNGTLDWRPAWKPPRLTVTGPEIHVSIIMHLVSRSEHSSGSIALQMFHRTAANLRILHNLLDTGCSLG